MYYPYLRGKQFELLALRDFSEYYRNRNNVFPVIEPVRETFNSMRLAIRKMQVSHIKFAVILNPKCGEIENDNKRILGELEKELSLEGTWMPAFIIDNDKDCDNIERIIEQQGYEDVMLIRKKDAYGDDNEFEKLASQTFVSKIIIAPAFKGTKRRLHKMRKEIIRLDDNFQPLARNSDYIGFPEELFSEEYRYYEDEGFDGIADYTVLSSVFSEGGRLPYAVAIHMTYEKKSDQIFVRHFVSDTNDDSSNIQGKFGEAAWKAIRFFEEQKIDNYAIESLKEYYEDGQYPGLGMIKKISIMNHLELMNEVLESEE